MKTAAVEVLGVPSALAALMLRADSVTTEERGKVWVSSWLICGKGKGIYSWPAHADIHMHTCMCAPPAHHYIPIHHLCTSQHKVQLWKGNRNPVTIPNWYPLYQALAHDTHSHYWRKCAAHHDTPHHCRGRQKPGVPANTRKERVPKCTLRH